MFRFAKILLEKTVKIYGLGWTNHGLEEIILHGLTQVQISVGKK